MKNMTIGQLAQKAEVNVQTIRYYERRGLLMEPPRSEAGYRHYADDALNQIHFIKRAQGLGFSLEQIKDLLTLQIESHDACQQIRQRAELKVAEVEEKLRLLQKMHHTLTDLIENCEKKQLTDPCPILQVLSTQGADE